MFYLAHISDIHLTPMPKIRWWQLFNKRITGYLNLKFNRKHNRNYLDRVLLSVLNHKVDHLVISGDIVNLATKAEFLNAKLWLQNILKKIPIALTLGNHDAYLIGSLKTACENFSAFLQSDIEQKNYFPNVKLNNNIAIINISTAIASPPFFAIGYFSKKQARMLSDILTICAEQNLFRIINMHHPPFKKSVAWHKRLWGAKNFTKAVKIAGAELILHGHTHKASLNYLNDIPVLGIGSCSKPCSTNANYNLFAIDRIDDKWHCSLERYGADFKGGIALKLRMNL